MKNKFAIIMPLSILVFCICLNCSNNKSAIEPEENTSLYSTDIFSIYIVKDYNYGKSEVGFDTLKLSKQPLLSSADITSYSWSKHHITYSEAVYERLTEFTDLWGKGFVVIAEGKRIYRGVFQTYLDSHAAQIPVIILFPRKSDMKHILQPAIYIRRSYFDGEGLETEPDPRSDTRIYTALEKAGILIP